jgi:ribosomal protein L40E
MRRRSMVQVCQNCQTENPDDAVFCSSCGMGLARARRRDEAEPVNTTVRDGIDDLQIAKFMWGWLLLGVGMPGMLGSALVNSDLALAGMLDSGLGAWMVWSVARRRGEGDARIRALMWAVGILTSCATAVAWVAAMVLAMFVGFACAEGGGGDCETLSFLALGALFVAPLVGAIIVLVGWLRRRQRLGA